MDGGEGEGMLRPPLFGPVDGWWGRAAVCCPLVAAGGGTYRRLAFSCLRDAPHRTNASLSVFTGTGTIASAKT
jgi:hypothetical protein